MGKKLVALFFVEKQYKSFNKLAQLFSKIIYLLIILLMINFMILINLLNF
jgi:hypothetical protein